MNKIIKTILIITLLISFTNICEAARVSVDDFERTDTDVYLRNATDNLSIGTTSALTKLTIIGTSTLSHVIPYLTDTYRLGDSSHEWASFYVDDLVVSSTTTLATTTISGTLTINGTLYLSGGISASSDMDMNYYDIYEAGYVSAEYFNASSTASTSLFAGQVQVNGTTTLATTTITKLDASGQVSFTDILGVTGATALSSTLEVDATSTLASTTVSDLLAVGTTTPYSEFIFSIASSTKTAIQELFNVNRNGYTGVGTSSPMELFSVHGNAYFGGNITLSGNVDGKDIATNAAMLNENETVTGAWIYSATSTFNEGLVFGDAASDKLSFIGQLDTGLVLAATTTTYGLDMNLATLTTDIRLSNGEMIDNATDDKIIVHASTTVATDVLGIGTSTPVAEAILSVATSTGSSYLHVDKNGYLAIGTTSPSSLLHIAVENTTSTVTIGQIGSPACVIYRDDDDGGWTYCVYRDGAETCSTNPCGE